MKNLKLPTSKKLWIPLLVLILTVQTVLLALVGSRVSTLWVQNEVDHSNPMSGDVRVAINNSLRSQYTSAKVNPKDHLVYLPSMRIHLPLNEKTERIVYSYSPDSPNEAGISTETVLNAFLNNWEQIPCTQRFVWLGINEPSQNIPDHSYEKIDGNVVLDDGRELHIYKNTMPGCEAVWGNIQPDDVINSLKRARSY